MNSFQEYFASPRRLVFVNGQVALKCSWDSPCREDIVSEYQTLGIEDYVYKLPGPHVPDRALMKHVGKRSSSVLGDLITVYSKRELSYQSDILNAFAGFADMMKNDCGVELCYGLVSTAISHSLLWRLSSSPTPRRMGFPSWSWCGWEGMVTAPVCPEGLSAWTTKYTWIHWYLYGGNNQFTLVPQKHWQPLETEHVSGTSTEWLEESDDSPLKFHSRLLKNLKPDKLTPAMGRMRLDTFEGSVDSSAPAPQYLEFLRKHGLDRATTTPPSILTVRDIEIDPGVSPEKHTLYLRTLSTTIYMSSKDPHGYDSLRDCRYVHLYNQLDQYLGVADISHEDVLKSLNVQRDASTALIDLRHKKIPINIAILSGPYAPSSETRRSIWIGEDVESLIIRARGFLQFYTVMLLMRHTSQNAKSVSVRGLYERAGLGERNPESYCRRHGLAGMGGYYSSVNLRWLSFFFT